MNKKKLKDWYEKHKVAVWSGTLLVTLGGVGYLCVKNERAAAKLTKELQEEATTGENWNKVLIEMADYISSLPSSPTASQVGFTIAVPDSSGRVLDIATFHPSPDRHWL